MEVRGCGYLVTTALCRDCENKTKVGFVESGLWTQNTQTRALAAYENISTSLSSISPTYRSQAASHS